MLFVGDPSHGSNRKIYTGYTNHLMPRLVQHCGLTSAKGARITRKQPIELAYLERYESRHKALQREFQLKHKSPFNQKKHKLMLVKEFESKHRQILQEINDTLAEQFKFLTGLLKSLENSEKSLKEEINPLK